MDACQTGFWCGQAPGVWLWLPAHSSLQGASWAGALDSCPLWGEGAHSVSVGAHVVGEVQGLQGHSLFRPA